VILKDSEGKKDTKAHVSFTISKEKKAEENKDEENKAEENKAEDNKAEENKAEDNKAEENKAEENKDEENKDEENKDDEEFTVNIEKCMGLESSYFSKIDPYIIVTYDGKS